LTSAPGIELPEDLSILTADLSSRIPKILIGNPGEQGRLAWDLIPNWRPRLAAGFHLDRDNDLRRSDGRRVAVPSGLARLLVLCDGRTFWNLVQALNTSGDLVATIEDAAVKVKAGRVLGVLHWHFMLDNRDGVFLRRRVLGQGPEGHEWFYLNSFTKAVFDLCSGAYSCRQIAELLAPAIKRPTALLLPQVVDTCQTLIHVGVIGWIDDEELRARRLEDFTGNLESVGTLHSQAHQDSLGAYI